jgi:hypothetical protein
MIEDWDAHVATLSPAEKECYEIMRSKSETFNIPSLEADALEYEPEDFHYVLMAAAFKAEARYRIPANEGPVPFALFKKHVQSFKSRFKNPVKVWYPHAVLHVQDSVTGKRGHFRLRPRSRWDPVALSFVTFDDV